MVLVSYYTLGWQEREVSLAFTCPGVEFFGSSRLSRKFSSLHGVQRPGLEASRISQTRESALSSSR